MSIQDLMEVQPIPTYTTLLFAVEVPNVCSFTTTNMTNTTTTTDTVAINGAGATTTTTTTTFNAAAVPITRTSYYNCSY